MATNTCPDCGLPMAPCPECGTRVHISTSWIYPDGDTQVVMNHDKPNDPDVPVCPGSLKPVA